MTSSVGGAGTELVVELLLRDPPAVDQVLARDPGVLEVVAVDDPAPDEVGRGR